MRDSCKNLASLPVSLITPCVVFMTVTKCAAGKKFVFRTDKDDAKCQACPTGTFNAKRDASTEYMKHKSCADAKVWINGTTTQDTLCETSKWI